MAKIHRSFVTNSSSSSFIIAGKSFNDIDDILEEFKRNNIEIPNDGEDGNACELLEILSTKLNMEYIDGADEGGYYLGFNLDATTVEDVIKVAEKAKKIFGSDCPVYSGTIYN
jgi:hypothetical protein